MLNVNSLLSWTSGLEEKMYKVSVLKLSQCVESHSCWLCLQVLQKNWVGHLNMVLLRGKEFKQTNLQKFHYLGGYPGVGGGNVEASNWLTHKCPLQPNFNKSELFSLVQANTNDLLWDKFFVVNLIF